MLVIASSMSLSLGFGLFRSSAAAAFCTGCELVGDRPSMVTILSPALRSPTGIEHDRITSPLICTEQAPHWATPQPYFVPVRPTCSRITHKSGVSGSTCTLCTRPLMLSLAMSVPLTTGIEDLKKRGLNSSGEAWLLIGARAERRKASLSRCGKHSLEPGGLPTPVAGFLRECPGLITARRPFSIAARRRHTHRR